MSGSHCSEPYWGNNTCFCVCSCMWKLYLWIFVSVPVGAHAWSCVACVWKLVFDIWCLLWWLSTLVVCDKVFHCSKSSFIWWWPMSLSCLPIPDARAAGVCYCTQLSQGCWDSNSGLYPCDADASLTEASPELTDQIVLEPASLISLTECLFLPIPVRKYMFGTFP